MWSVPPSTTHQWNRDVKALQPPCWIIVAHSVYNIIVVFNCVFYLVKSWDYVHMWNLTFSLYILYSSLYFPNSQDNLGKILVFFLCIFLITKNWKKVRGVGKKLNFRVKIPAKHMHIISHKKSGNIFLWPHTVQCNTCPLVLSVPEWNELLVYTAFVTI